MPTPDNARDPFDLIGTTIEGKYRVASVIGDGGFGVVYRGVHTGFGELIAIKCLKIPSNLDEKHRQDLLEQLREEGRLLHKLSKATPGIVQALDVGAMTTPAGLWVPYLVLEWLEGETLADLQRQREEQGLGGMPITEAIELLTPAARALAVAHQNKIAHRDVKPANLFVTKVGDRRTVKVLDFGIAKVLTDSTMTEALAVTRQGPSAFTPRYGAPEQFNKQRGASGPWTDVFALALIVVELTTGRRALDGDDPTQLYVASADPTLRPTFRGRGLDVTDAVEAVISKALHVEPKYRYPDAGEMWDALVAAAGLAPDPTRVSQPTVSSGRGSKPTDPGRTALTSDPNLATADFAAQASLAVPTEARPSGPPEPHAQTRPAESVFASEPPLVIVSGKPDDRAATPPPVTSASTLVAGAAKEPAAPAGAPRGRMSADDPMAETPLYARVPRNVAEAVEARVAAANAASAGAAGAGGASKAGGPPVAPTRRSGVPDPGKTTTTPSSRDAPGSAPASSEGPSGGSGRGLLWALLVIGVGAAATGYLYFTRPGAGGDAPGAKGSGSTPAPVRTLAPPHASASATATASASASAAATASTSAEVTPPAPPEDMVYIAPMAAVKLGEGPTRREVTLTRGFYLDKKEVSAGAFHQCVAAGACQPASEVKSIQRLNVPGKAPGAGGGEGEGGAAAEGPGDEVKQYEDTWRARCTEPHGQNDHPINCVTYAQADAYCKWRKRRLPTEAEWEAAAQGVEGRPFPWGSSGPDCERACVDRNSSDCRSGDVATCAAGSHAGDRTPTEVFDMAGNVAEWVADGFLAKPLAGTDPRANPFAKTHVVRGGDFFHSQDLLRSATRREAPAGAAEAWIGVRCAMDVPAPP